MVSWRSCSGSLQKLSKRFGAIFWLGAISVIVAHSVRAQQLQPESYSGFDGQTVSKVDVAAGPSVNRDQIAQLIQQKTGQPFSADAVRASVNALQQTHLFSEVQLTMEPEPSGLHLTFILQPADYVGVLQFPGLGGSRFPYASLLQAANIPEQSPYVPGLEAQAAQGVVNFLHTRGFFSAEVTPEIQRDEPHHVVNIIFHCTLENQARIGNIEFAGVDEERSDRVRAALKSWWARLKRVSLKPGQKYSQPRVTKSVPYIRDHLKVAGQLAPAIRLNAPQYDAETNRVDVNFEVTAGPKVTVKVEGAKLSDKKLRQLVPIFQENAVDIELVDEGEANVNAYFQSKGYFDSTTSSNTAKNDGEVNVVYTVKPGAKHKVKSVNFDGNQHFSDKQLATQVAVSKRLPIPFVGHGKYSEQLLDKSATSLTQYYKNAGYANVSIQPKVEDFEPQVFVTFIIKEGPRDQVASLKLQGNATQSLTALSNKYPLPMRTGGAYSAKLLDQDRNQLLAAYLDLGYLNANVESSASPTVSDPHKIDVTFSVDEGPRAYVSDVVMIGQQHTKPQFIQVVSGNLVRKGQPQSQRNFLQAESNLYDLGVFDWASVMPLRPIADQTQEEVLEKVHESPLNSMDIGGGIEIIPRGGNIPVNSVAVPGLPPISIGNKFTVSQKSYVGPRFEFAFTRHNIRGHAETATIGTIASRLDQKVFFNFANPHLRSSSWNALLSISAERTTENPIYTAELFDASFQLEKPLDAKGTKHFIVRYSFNRTNLYDLLIPNLVLPQDRHVRLSSFEADYIRDTRDKPLDAHRGVYQTFDAGITSTALGASADFIRFLGQSAFYIPMKPWLVWANNFRVGFAIPYSSSYVPISERFFTGGADSLRGFPINGAGPQRPLPVCVDPADPSTCTLISVPEGGNMLFIVNSEARFPLPIYHGIGGVFFYDGGNVYSSIRLSQFVGNFTHSVGAGLRYDTPVGPVRFDFGYRITNVPGVDAKQYFVTLGQSF